MMTDYRIEREVMIEAPVEVVWRTITEPEQVARWFADRVELEAEPGRRGVFVFEDADGEMTHSAPLVVDVVEPPTRFSFRWGHPADEEPKPGNSMHVEFLLVADGGERTRLRVVESGLNLLAAWDEDKKVRYAEDHSSGWARFTDRLATLLADRATR